ncbi:MAG: M13 family metallopeptidase [Bacteroidetes bacterium]|nr:M13 family metallopeptidase [Bacteroidota bacterium]
MVNHTLKHTLLILLGVATILGTGTACKKQEKGMKALSSSNMDTTVKAGDDFYHYANGNWLKNNPIPAEYSRYGAFEVLEEENYKQLQELMKDASADKNAKQGSVNQKIRDFYNTGMDTISIDKAGMEPIKPEFAKIDALKTTEDIQKQVVETHLFGLYPLFNFFGAPDEKNSNKVIAQLYQGGLCLPDRDYYLGTDTRSAEIRKEYVKYIAKMFTLTGIDAVEASKQAETVMKIETELAKISSTKLELRNPIANYNKYDLAGLKTLAPGFNWESYFSGMGITATSEINVGQPKFFKGVTGLLSSIPVNDWKIYLKWNLLNNTAEYLSSNLDKEHFSFFGTVMSGTTEQQPRWKRILDNTSSSLGEAVGQLYVAKFFPPAAKERMITLVNNLKSALHERILNLTWMSDSTKKEAIAKLDKINVKVGYPDKWIDYSSMDITNDSYFRNNLSASKFLVKKELAKIGKAVDRSEWGMTPQTVNAYYNPNMNEIVFPAAILQPPFFWIDADDAVNYGAIGVVIGHEMSHGFDDQGRQYDKEGNLTDWWKPEDSKNFEKQTKVLVDQYNQFKILDSLHVDGQLTLGENIADLGGVNISYTAFLKAMEGKDMKAAVDGFTPTQRFFLSYAQVWRNNIREKALMRRLKEDVHSPGEARVNGIVYNIPAFYQAFDIKPADKRFIPEDKRATIW